MRLLVIWLFLVGTAWADPRIDELCHKYYDNPNGPGGAVAVIVHGKVVHKKCYGKTDKGAPITPTTTMYLASVSKQFTATCVMILADHGKLRLHDEVRQYFPALPASKTRPIRIDDLLTMRAGIKEYNMSDNAMTPKKLIAYYADENLETPTGTHHEYSNGSYVLLGYLVEKISGQSLKAFEQQHIFGPLKMTHTSFLDGDTGDAGITSCLDDMILWEDALRNHPVVSAEMLKLSWTQAHLDNGQAFGYGFGWKVGADSKYVQHNGHWAGTSTYIGLDAASGTSIIILSNVESTAQPLAEAIAALD